MGKNYLDTKIKEMCNGCGACALVCPTSAISMAEDKEGFFYPEINEKICIKCNKCRIVCSNDPIHNDYPIKAFATKNKNEKQRKDSTSGGMFKILAEYVIEKDGVVFGVELDENLKAIHSFSDSLDECKKYSMSKYVRSDLNNSYENVKESLEKGKIVLFTGTPCQVQGLKSFLGKKNDNLITCEIMCHSNPSPRVLEMYIKNTELLYGKKVKKFFFRSKNQEMDNKAYMELNDGTKVNARLYIKAFTGCNLISRPSCNKCMFVDENRKADFTIGDFWGIDKIFPDFNDKKGVSLLTINSDKAYRVFETIKNKMEYIEVDLQNAFSGNHHANIIPSKNRKIFFKGIAEGTINEKNIISYMEKYTRTPLYKSCFNKGKKIINKIIKK